MPITIPAQQSYQAPLVPLRGLWNQRPKEGDRLIGAEIDWGTYNKGPAVKFDVGGNSPVSLNQIVALYVDNGRCGADIDFLFPDTGFLLTVPAHIQGLYPVLTNSLSFYAINNAEGASDITIIQICNTLPPPITIQPSTVQTSVATVGQPMASPGTVNTQVVPLGVSGSVTGLSIHGTMYAGAAAGLGIITLLDGSTPSPKVLWQMYVQAPANGVVAINADPTNLDARFINGLVVQVVTVNAFTTGQLTTNVYYTTP